MPAANWQPLSTRQASATRELPTSPAGSRRSASGLLLSIKRLLDIEQGLRARAAFAPGPVKNFDKVARSHRVAAFGEDGGNAPDEALCYIVGHMRLVSR